MINNGNGETLEHRMTYDDLIKGLNYDRDSVISELTQSRIDTEIQYNGLIEALHRMCKYNDIEVEPEFFLQDEQVLYNEYYDAVKGWYESKTNEEIVEFYRVHEPYVFGMIDSLQALFDKSP